MVTLRFCANFHVINGDLQKRALRRRCFDNVRISYCGVLAMNGLKPQRLTLAFIVVWTASGLWAASANEPALLETRELISPVGPDAREPFLSELEGGRVLMSWTEAAGNGFAVKVAIADSVGWSDARVVVESEELFVNWADFPSTVAMADGTLVAHWLQINGEASYQYDIKIAMSPDEGKTWGPSIILHDDRSQREHGFVTLLPKPDNTVSAIWLDGQAYDAYAAQDITENAMQLRTRSIVADGRLGPETLLDGRTCTCCQTSAALTQSGAVLAVYRDRSSAEVRDISVVRHLQNRWSAPARVYDDGWVIEGCPVNGPAIDTKGSRAAVAWFTASEDIPKVRVAFSDDDGVTFRAALRIDNGAPSGRVDVLQQPDGAAIVSWVERTGKGETIMICRVLPDTGCAKAFTLGVISLGRTVGFPRMALAKDAIVIAWTEPAASVEGSSGSGSTIRTRMVPLAAFFQ